MLVYMYILAINILKMKLKNFIHNSIKKNKILRSKYNKRRENSNF